MPSVAAPRAASTASRASHGAGAGHGIAVAGGPRFGRLRDLVLPVGIIASVLVILVRLPPSLMDVLLSANITIAVIMLLTTIYVRTPLEFSIFPSLLLATTLFRLVLNVATTRLILTRAGSEGLLAAGGVVEGLRRVRGRRPDRRGADHLRHHRGDPVRGHHQGGHAHQRGGRPLRLGRHARPADGHRRRPERRHHRRARGPAPPPRDHPAGRLLRRHGRCQQVRPRRRHRRHRHHADQHRRRAVHRRDRGRA